MRWNEYKNGCDAWWETLINAQNRPAVDSDRRRRILCRIDVGVMSMIDSRIRSTEERKQNNMSSRSKVATPRTISIDAVYELVLRLQEDVRKHVFPTPRSRQELIRANNVYETIVNESYKYLKLLERFLNVVDWRKKEFKTILGKRFAGHVWSIRETITAALIGTQPRQELKSTQIYRQEYHFYAFVYTRDWSLLPGGWDIAPRVLGLDMILPHLKDLHHYGISAADVFTHTSMMKLAFTMLSQQQQ